MSRVKPMNQIRPNVAMIDVGNRDGGDERRAQVRQEQQHDQRGQNRPDDEVFFDVVDRRFDELRGVANDAQFVAGGQRLPDFVDALFGVVSDLDGVRAGLPPDVEQHGRRAVDARHGVGVGHAVFDRRDVGDPDRVALVRLDDDVVEFLDASATRPRVRSVTDCGPWSIRPPGISAFCRFSARATSVTVTL